MRLSTDSPSLSPSLLFVPHGKFHPLPVLKFSTTHAPIYVRASAYARLPRWQDLPVSKRGERSILSRPFHPYASRRSRDRTFEESGNAFLVAARRRRAIYIRPRTMPRILLNSTFHAFPLRGIYIYIAWQFTEERVKDTIPASIANNVYLLTAPLKPIFFLFGN